MRIVVLDGGLVNPGDISWAPLEALGELDVYGESTKAEAIERVRGAEAIVSNRTVLDEEVLAAGKRLRYVGLFSTGTNTVELAAAARLGITVTNVPGYSTAAVAQHTVALLLALTNGVAGFDASVQAGNWQSGWFAAGGMVELAGKTFGCVGFGAIGRAAGGMARALGMRVLAAGSRPVDEGRAIAEYVPLDTLLAESDVVSLHCPLKPETKGLIDRAALAKIKDGAILLNTARGGLLVQEDVAAALKSGKLRAAGLDVVAPEPVEATNPLLGLPNCLITPHVAWGPPETRARLVARVAENLRCFADGEPINTVN